MKIEKIEIWNLRSFKHQEILLNEYTCFVGPNGAGKSTILCALNIFFRQTDHTGTNLLTLEKEDFHRGDTSEPIAIRVTFDELSEEAKEVFSHYVRSDKLIITAEAAFDKDSGKAKVQHFGERLAMTQFAEFFELSAAGAKVSELNPLYEKYRTEYPNLPKANSKDAKMAALRQFEGEREDLCKTIRSEDQFYGVSKGANRLEKFVQWVYVPAVKDAVGEQAEEKNSALGKLLARAVRAKTDFQDEIQSIKETAQQQYQNVLTKNKSALDLISSALNERLGQWAHKGVTLGLEWQEDQDRSIRIEEPLAHVKVSEGLFEAQIARLGHGLQRSYLIALLQELAIYDREDAPKLILAIEEPELYQHPPQARHLSDVLVGLAKENAQVVLCSHSPYFVSGSLFEDVRLVKKQSETSGSEVVSASAIKIAEKIGVALEKPFVAPSGTIARLHQILQPQLSEMFFCSKIVFVEGREDVAFIKSYLELEKVWESYRSFGLQIVAVDKKSEILRPLIIAQELEIPSFVVFDADGHVTNEDHRKQHEIDNMGLFRALGFEDADAFPQSSVMSENAAVWSTCMGNEIEDSVDSQVMVECKNEVGALFDHSSGMKKNILYIGELVKALHQRDIKPKPLQDLLHKLFLFVGDGNP